jgi:glutaredoxin 3
MVRILIYATSWCPYCQMAKRLLAAKGQPWEEVDLEDEPGRRTEMVERSGRTTVPQIWIGDRHVGGYDELSRLAASGELDRLLAERASAGSKR